MFSMFSKSFSMFSMLRVTPSPGDWSLESARGRGTSHGGFLACLGRFKGGLRRFKGF